MPSYHGLWIYSRLPKHGLINANFAVNATKGIEPDENKKVRINGLHTDLPRVLMALIAEGAIMNARSNPQLASLDACNTGDGVKQPRMSSQPMHKLEVSQSTVVSSKKIVQGSVGSGRYQFRVCLRRVYDPVADQMSDDWTPVYKLKSMTMELNVIGILCVKRFGFTLQQQERIYISGESPCYCLELLILLLFTF